MTNATLPHKAALTAVDVMTAPVVTVREDQDIGTLSWNFVRLHVTGMPVVDAKGALLGMISQTDLAAYIWDQEQRDPEAARAPVHARDLMTRKVITAGPRTSVVALAHTMRRLKIHRVPIVQGGRLVGIVTTMDLLKTF